MTRSLPLPDWPGNAQAAVSLTFDVDSDAVFRGVFPDQAHRLSTCSLFRYGVTRGLPRLLRLLQRRELPATFYVPGVTAETYPDIISRIAAAGHEIAHHGYRHVRPDHSSPAEQRIEIERGLEALDRVAGVRPRGYRAPCAELTSDTFELLIDQGFLYDSSCMGDDRPYFEEQHNRKLLELPIAWALDDAPYFLFTLDHGSLLPSPTTVLDTWRMELELAKSERRHVTYVMHPEVMGRGPQVAAFARFLDELSDDDVWIATHAAVASHALATSTV